MKDGWPLIAGARNAAGVRSEGEHSRPDEFTVIRVKEIKLIRFFYTLRDGSTDGSGGEVPKK